MLNIVALMGRLVHTPELRKTTSGVSTCTLRIAVDRSYAPAGEERRTDFIDVVTWRQTAEFVCKYFQKGSPITVDGALRTRQYEDKNGNRRTAVEVVANSVHFTGERARQDAGPAGYGQAQTASSALAPATGYGQARPRAGAAQNPNAPRQMDLRESMQAVSRPAPEDDFSIIDDGDGDIPF